MLLRPRLHIKTEVHDGVFSASNIAAVVTGDGAPKFSIESFVEEAWTIFIHAVGVSLSSSMQPVDEKLIELVGILLPVAL